MPLPNPSSFQNRDDYISKCMSDQKGEDREHKQKLAICFSKWERKNESDIVERINRLIGDETVAANIATNTSGKGYPIAKRKKRKKKEYEVTEGFKVLFKMKKSDKKISVAKYKDKKSAEKFLNSVKKDGGNGIISTNESIFGATLTNTGIQGSGQTRAVGDTITLPSIYNRNEKEPHNNLVLNLKKPVRFNHLTGTFVPVEEALSHKRTPKQMKAYYEELNKLVKKGMSFESAADKAREVILKGRDY